MRVLICCALTASFVVVSALPANAQLQNLLDLLFPKPPAEPVPAPGPGTAPAVPVIPGPAPVVSRTSGSSSSGRAPFPLAVPQIRRSPARSTAVLFERLRAVVAKGMPMERALLQAVPPFPVAGPSKFSHDWGFPRYTPTPHLHKGTDIFAAFGTPIVTSESGRVIAKGTAGAGGISVWVGADTGTAYYYAHLQSWVKGLAVGQRVEKGAVIGFVGDTGNAEGGSPHLHFEIHPGGKGSPARDPKPFLDDALRQAEERALALANGTGALVNRGGSGQAPLLIINKHVDRLLQSSEIQSPEDVLWFSMMDPTLGVLGLARQSALDAGLPSGALSTAEVQEETRMDAVRAAVASPQARMIEFVSSALLKDEALVVGPVGLALASSAASDEQDSGLP
ncbi:MAG: M23 family metallopeptidase [Actinomycetota bacterium]